MAQIDKHGNIIRNNVPVNSPPAPASLPPSMSSSPSSSSSYSSSYNVDIPDVPFYIITLAISAIAAWLISAFIGVHVFNPSNASGWLQGISKFFHTVGPYAIFLGGFAGCIWYNAAFSSDNDVKEVVLSILSGIGGAIAVGILTFLLAIIIQIVVGIIVVVIAISIFAGG